MKQFITLLLLLIASSSYSQENEIYRLAFSDSSNFSLTTSFGHEQPAKLLIIDTTATWNTKRFWLKELAKNPTQTINQIERDEHHPYNLIYLFKDSTLNKIIQDNEKKSLSRNAEKLPSRKIAIHGENYATIPSPEYINGFYFLTTAPLFTSDQKFAFIDITVIRKNNVQDHDAIYFGSISLVYQKQHDKWKKIKVKHHVIL